MNRTQLILLALLLSSCMGSGPLEAPVDATLEAFVADGLDVHETHKRDFEMDGETVAITHAEYGEQQDCPSGCFSSHVCAIEDASSSGGPQLFYAAWYAEEETPLGLEEECPELAAEAMETWPDCEPSGFRHAVTETEEFKTFAADQIGSGPMRWCFNRFMERFGG